jgi:16S rRNA (adenine1518-N6/adenine1519-N6)-dimethyltransferase
VQSGVIKLKPVKKDLVMKSERSFYVLVKTAFNQRRKTMRNSVKSLFDPEVLKDEMFVRRAETFSVEEFAALTFKMR